MTNKKDNGKGKSKGKSNDNGKSKSKGKSNDNGKKRGKIYIPTHRDKTAMNGAPDLLWLVEEDDSKTGSGYGEDDG
jgi:hypothetical protein